MMKRTKRRIAYGAIAAVLIALAVVLFFVLRKDKPTQGGDVTPTVAPTTVVNNNDKEATKAPTATAVPDKEPTKAPEVTEEPTATEAPTMGAEPTAEPTPDPNATPTPEPVPGKNDEIAAPTFGPTATPTPVPTLAPDVTPTEAPKPTATPKPSATPKPTATPKPEKLEAAYFYEELAKACHIQEGDAVAALKSRGIIPNNANTKKVVRKDAFVALMNAYNYLGFKSDTNMVQVVTNLERLSDISGLTAAEKEAANFVFGNGIVEGVSDGDYTRTRSMNPNAELSKDDADLYIGRTAGRKVKRELSPDGQLTRRSYLRNMDLYPYILESIPDKFYTRAFTAMMMVDPQTGKSAYESGKDYGDGNIWIDGGGAYASPMMYRKMYGPNGTARNKHHVLDSVYLEEALEKAVEEYLWKVFNVDYRTTPSDKEWKNYMLEMLRGLDMLHPNDITAYDRDYVDSYLKVMKDNHTVIECDMVRAEASTLHEYSGCSYIRCYVHYRVNSFDSTESVWTKTGNMTGGIDPLLCNLMPQTYPMVNLQNLKEGEWRDGYFEIRINHDAEQGIEPMKVWWVEFYDYNNNYTITDY